MGHTMAHQVTPPPEQSLVFKLKTSGNGSCPSCTNFEIDQVAVICRIAPLGAADSMRIVAIIARDFCSNVLTMFPKGNICQE